MRPKFTSILMIFLIVFSSYILISAFIEEDFCPLVNPEELNYAPLINSTYPSNGALDISIAGTSINAYIYDFENDSLWTEIWSNHTGAWVQYAGFNLGLDYENKWFMVDFDNSHHWNESDMFHYYGNSGLVESGQYAFFENNSVTDSWGMNQPATTYYWSINTTDNTTWTNQTFYFSTLDDPPSITNVSPNDGAIDIELNPTISVNLNDTDGNSLNIYFWTNATGSWELIGYNTSVNNGTYSQNTSNMNNYNTKYWWSVNATDGIKWTNETYNFTTRAKYIPSPPTAFTASAMNRTQIDLGWIPDTMADKTYVERNIVEGWGMGTGTEVYNGTGSGFSDTSLIEGTIYYYQAWSYNNTDNVYNTTFAEANDTTIENLAPTLTNEMPVDKSIGIDLSLATVNVTIKDPEGDLIDWTIEGFYVNDASGTDEANGSKQASLITLLPYDNVIVWYVNVTDGTDWTNYTYNFTTRIADVFVDDDEVPGWYDATHVLTIQEAIYNATAGNRVYVYNGTYSENVIVNQTINLIGEDKNNTIIDGCFSGDVVGVYDNWVNITGFTIQNSDYSASGVKLNTSVEYCQITNNIISNNSCGILLQNSNNNYINNNSMFKNSILINGTHLYNWNSHTITNNTLNNKPIYYWKNKTNDIMPSDASQIILANCTNITIQNQNISNGSIGISLGFTYYSTIINNTISNNTLGIYMGNSTNNYIIKNNIVNNTKYGIYLSSNSSYNTFYHNNFIRNNINSYDQHNNTWYYSILHQGNYWGDFDEPGEGAFDNNSDGIIDQPYNISNGDNQDLYPLTGPWGQIPYQATLVFPSDGLTGITTSPILKVRVYDPNNDTMNVTFYSSPGNAIIGTDTNVTNGDNATVTWSGLTYYTSYGWYVVVNDSNYLTKSDTWVFKTKTRTSGGSGGGGGGGYIPSDDTGDDETNPPTAVPRFPYNALTYQPITFDGSDSTDDGTIIEYKWTFGDNSTGWGIKPTHTYNTSGVFVVTLTVRDDTNLTDSKTTMINIILDTDGDGWSDEDEEYYGTDKTNINDIPRDNDNDGILDLDDEDDDNDIISDEIEIKLGTNPNIKDITIEIFNGIVFYLLDLDGDDKPDRFYNTSSEKDINIKIRDDGTYLINTDDDGYWDYVYDPASGQTTNYDEKSGSSNGVPWLTIASAIIIIIIAIFAILYILGYIRIEEE